jgi:hypothetical protein
MKRIGDLEIDQDIAFQKHEWQVQRVAWVVMALIVLLAALGLFGTGLLSSASASDPNGVLTVDYQRFIRHDGRTTLTVNVAPELVTGDSVEIWLAADYHADVQIEQISPEPQEVRTDGDRLIYVLAVEGVTGPLELSFALRPQAIGRVSVEVGLVDGPQVAFSHVSYP